MYLLIEFEEPTLVRRKKREIGASNNVVGRATSESRSVLYWDIENGVCRVWSNSNSVPRWLELARFVQANESRTSSRRRYVRFAGQAR